MIMAIENSAGAFCPRFHTAVELIGRRWTGAILRAMRSGHSRFTDIAAVVPGLHDRLLADRLRELEAAGVIRREVAATSPGRVDYRLTEMGHDLDHVMDAIALWAEKWVPGRPCEVADSQAALVDATCETTAVGTSTDSTRT